MYMHAAVRHRDGAEQPRARDGRSRRMPTAPGFEPVPFRQPFDALLRSTRSVGVAVNRQRARIFIYARLCLCQIAGVLRRCVPPQSFCPVIVRLLFLRTALENEDAGETAADMFPP